MENEIMKNIAEEVMEHTEDIIPVVKKRIGGGKVVTIVLGVIAAGYGVYRFGKDLVNDHKAKKAAKEDIPEDITEDEIEEIPGNN